MNGVQQFASDPIGTVAGVFGGGDPSGNDGGSSNWAAWGHEEIRSMLDDTVVPAHIHERARVWGELQTRAVDLVTGSANDQRNIVSNGWRGELAEAAIRSLTPVDEWANTLSAAMQNTSQLMDHSGSAADHAKAAVPEPQSHNWGQSLGSFAVGGGPGALVDAVAQDRAQEEARMEAVRIMHSAYSAPINESRVAVRTYPQLADPTLRPPEQAPVGGPSPGAGSGGAGMPGGGAGGGVPGGGVPGGGAYQPPAVAGLQGVPRGPGGPGGPVPTPAQFNGPRSPGGPGNPGPGGGGFGSDAAAGVPFAPLGGTGAGGDAERARRGFRGGGRPGVLGGRVGGGAGGGAGFGPRGSGLGAASAADGRFGAGGVGSGAGAAGGAAGRGGVGGVPLAGAGAGRGQGGEDDEHRRPSYLIETDDIFGDGRKVAPPVIGEDPPEHYR
ncbi:MAG: hypothetical protein ACRDSL_23165 [Pseudonocardiaceae bacterium]